jgi:hypothetical protein
MTTPEIEPDYPNPPRFRQLKRWTVIGILALTSLVALRYWWGVEAQRRLDAFVTSAHARGRKALLSDFDVARIPDDQNSATLLRQAANSLKYDEVATDWENTFENELPLTKTDLDILARLKPANANVIRDMRRARALNNVNWGIVNRAPAYTILLPHLNDVRGLANLASYVALYEHTLHNDQEVVELTRDILFETRSTEKGPVFLISHLVANGVDHVATNVLFQVAPSLSIQSLEEKSTSTGSATPTQVRALIADLLDENSVIQGASDCWQGEQSAMIEDAPANAAQQLPNPRLIGLIAPMLTLQSLRSAANLDTFPNALAQPTYTQARAVIPAVARTSNASTLYNISRVLGPSLAIGIPARHIQNDFTIRAQHRLAAAALAIRLYQSDHNGNRPNSLDALVPAYLPQVPRDPFSPDNKPLIYRADPAHPVLYSLGINQRDDGGIDYPSGTSTKPRRPQPLDIIIDLLPTPSK